MLTSALVIGWSFPCDVFSLGCILVEFYTGVALFQTHDNLEHLAMMECVMGKMPERLARAGQMSKAEYFVDGPGVPRINFPTTKTSRQSRKEVRAVKRLQDTIPPIHGDPSSRTFLDLVRQLLALDPVHRITVRQALQHPYFNHEPVNG
jgi:dual-specificity kinase